MIKLKKKGKFIKTILRKLPPKLTEEEFNQQLEPFSDLIHYKYFLKGKLKYPIFYSIGIIKEF